VDFQLARVLWDQQGQADASRNTDIQAGAESSARRTKTGFGYPQIQSAAASKRQGKDNERQEKVPSAPAHLRRVA
jgi:hypothetical protein